MTLWKRSKLWLASLFIDHSFFRVWLNTPSRVGPHLFRSSHPMPYQFRRAQRQGMGSVINLRGSNDAISSNVMGRYECARIGLPLVHYALPSREAPSKEDVLGYALLLEELPKPILVHCKSGADRAGLAAALYLLIAEQASPERAMQQLRFWPYGHIQQAKTGVLDHFLASYRQAQQTDGIGFLEWIRTRYDPTAVNKSFRSQRWANRLVDHLLKRE